MCIREVVVHKKFMKDGKATIRLPDQRLQLLISNCPPDKLAVFLKTLQVSRTLSNSAKVHANASEIILFFLLYIRIF